VISFKYQSKPGIGALIEKLKGRKKEKTAMNRSG
jgi:hypothetical protein